MAEPNVSTADEIQGFYEDHADSYNSMMDAEIELPMYTAALGGLADRIANLDDPVLDTSCGTGHMLEKFADDQAGGRQLLGVDLSPHMVAIARRRLGAAATVEQGDMGGLIHIPDASCAAVLSFFALHHVDAEGVNRCFVEWFRILGSGGQVLVAAWEGDGPIDYGDAGDIVAMRYRADEFAEAATSAGFRIDSCLVRPVEEMEMDAAYLVGTR